MNAALMPTEFQIQKALVAFMESSPWYRGFFFHPPQERHERHHAFKLKHVGVKAGVPDLLVVRPSGTFTGLALELKRDRAPPSAVSRAQRQWLSTLEQCGWCARVARGIDEGMAVLRWYADGARPDHPSFP